MFSSTLPNPFLAWEGEAPAEPWRRRLGRSLALPLVSNAFDIAKMFRAVALGSRDVSNKSPNSPDSGYISLRVACWGSYFSFHGSFVQ